MMQFEGALSVKAVILAGKRQVQGIIIDEKKKDKDTSFIIREARKRNIKVSFEKRESIDQFAVGKTHGGIIAKAGMRNYQKLEDIYQEDGFYCILEGIEDPFNLGYCFRSLYAAGCSGVIIAQRDWSSAEDVIVRSSAGASEYLSVIMSENIAHEIDFLKSQDVKVVSAHRKEAISIYDMDFSNKICVAIGGEMRGLSKVVLNNSEGHIYIPYGKDVKVALNASSATAVIAFEISRQRRKG